MGGEGGRAEGRGRKAARDGGRERGRAFGKGGRQEEKEGGKIR